jgi:AcrR family transcriptional regulator
VPPRGRRPVGGADTRETIVAAARVLFAERGYERTTMRAVAEAAAVDPALIHHYFGNKEGLLAETLALPVDPSVVLAGLESDPSTAGSELVRRIVGVWESQPEVRERMIALLRTSVSHPPAAAVVRDVLGSTVLAGIARVVQADHPELRASLVGTQIGGLMLGRYILGIPGVADATPEELVAAIGPVVQHYLTGTIEVQG